MRVEQELKRAFTDFGENYVMRCRFRLVMAFFIHWMNPGDRSSVVTCLPGESAAANRWRGIFFA